MGFWYFVIEFECFLLIMILVAFFILCERKFLGYIQLRKGPNKVGVVGLFQSFADLLKLLLKFNVFGYTVRSWFGGLGCFLLLGGALFFCLLYSITYYGVLYSNWILWFLVVSSIISYGVLMLGWGSWSKFSLIGGIRSSFSGVSFEAVFMCLVLVLGELYGDYNYQSCGSVVLLFPIFYYIWWVSILGENNRAPLDFGESESELVSGFNTEYSGVPFMIIFACEYLGIYIFSWITSGLFMVDFSLIVLLHLVMYIWFRGTFPRIRYNDYVFLLWRWGLVISLFGVLVLYNL
uniref:NADH-ubiquinone oxidoreductase chain 1 n=1 Tax=Trichobilharzia regenti TaxID=157069 RepID=A7J1L2_TRIRE|nr:NADH dehydrogenase subunit 1 [Trichobilharzia regenti]ABG91501.1 NADH dehydrogenase subunit 1 [Trichobilharzia regenti]BAV82972.1 NADH dehydrogenase subunit 1 [Trichobilharzia regenti]